MLHPKLIIVFIVCLVFSVTNGVLAQDGKFADFRLFEDSSKKIGVAQALELYKQGKFIAQSTSEVNMGFTRSVFWLAYYNQRDRPADSLLLNIGHSHINRIQFFYVDTGHIRRLWLTGDYFPFAQRPVNATGFYFPINKKGLYLALIDKSNESLQLSFKLGSHVQVLAAESNQKLIMGCFSGMIFLLLVFGLYLFAISKEKVYVYYALYMATGWLWVLSNAGYGFEYLWPQQPWFASKARPVFALAPMAFSLLFLRGYIGGIKNRRLDLSVSIISVLLAACILTIFLFNENGYQSDWWLYIQYFIPYMAICYVVIIFAVLLLAVIKGNRIAKFYLVAILTLLLSAILQISFSLGSLDQSGNFFSHYGLSVGYIMEAIILTAGLVYRFNSYRLEKEKLLIEMNRRQLENTRIMLEVQEAERSQVADQLHDVAGSLLSAARLNLSALRENGMMPGEKSKGHAEKAEEAVELVSGIVRNLSHALSPVMLKQVGFRTTLEKIVGIFNASGKIHITLLILGFENYKPERNLHYTALYSIIYELLNNIVKHSGASNALLQVTEEEDRFSLMVEDDGKGIGNLQKRKQTGGIPGIQSKIDYFAGSMAIDDLAPKGLIITIEIPLTDGKISAG